MFDFLSTFFLSSAALATLGFGTPDQFSSIPPSRLVAEVENYNNMAAAFEYCNSEWCAPINTGNPIVSTSVVLSPDVYDIGAFSPSYTPPVSAQFLFIPLGYVAQTQQGQQVFVPYVVDSNGGNSAGMGGGVVGGSTVSGGQPSNTGDPLDGLQGSYSGTINDRTDPADAPSPYNANDPMATGGYQPTPGAVGGLIPGPAIGPDIGIPTGSFTPPSPVGTPVAPSAPVTGPVGTPAPATPTTGTPAPSLGSLVNQTINAFNATFNSSWFGGLLDSFSTGFGDGVSGGNGGNESGQGQGFSGNGPDGTDRAGGTNSGATSGGNY